MKSIGLPQPAARGWAFGVGIAAMVSSLAMAADWAQWRGPTRDGVVHGGPALAETWAKHGPPRTWESEEIPSGKAGNLSSLVVADGKVFVYVNWHRTEPKSQKLSDDVVLCLDAETGETLWRTQANGKATGWNFSSTPCVDDGKLYLLVSGGEAVCMETQHGEVLWRTPAPQAKNVSSSFLVADGLAVILAGPLTAFDVATGEIKWTQPKISGRNPSPVLWRPSAGARVVCNTGSNVGCADLATGEFLWGVPGGSSSTTATKDDVCVVFSSRPDVGLSAYRMAADAAEKLWTFDFVDRGSSPVIDGGYVYAVGGRGNARSLCLKLDSGEVAWDQKLSTQEISSPILADGKVIGVLDNYASLAMWKATPDAYTELAKVPLATAACTSPALADGRLYLRLNSSVVCHDLRAASAPAR